MNDQDEEVKEEEKENKEDNDDNFIWDSDEIDEDDYEELSKLLDEIIEENEAASDKDKDEKKKPKKKKKKSSIIIFKTELFDNIIFETIFNIIINFLIIFALNAVFKPIICEIWVLIVLVSIYMVLDKIMRYFMQRHFKKIIIMTFGSFLILSTIICLTLANLLLYFLNVLSYYSIIGAIICFIVMKIVSKFIEFYLIRLTSGIKMRKKGNKK